MILDEEIRTLMQRRLLVPLTLWAAFCLPGCNSQDPRTTSFADSDAARADFEKLAAVADRIFWRATDRCMRDSGSGMTQIPERNFIEAHECQLVELVQREHGRDTVFVGTVKIFDPNTPAQWFEMEFEEAGNGWQGLDCRLMMDGHEMNYFEGQFLSATNLKPYVDEAIEFVMARGSGDAPQVEGPAPDPA